MILVKVSVHVSLPEAPGDRGRKLEYFMAKPRHKIVAPVMLFNSVALMVAAWFVWRSRSHGIAVLLATMSLANALLSVIIWRRGARREDLLRKKLSNGTPR